VRQNYCLNIRDWEGSHTLSPHVARWNIMCIWRYQKDNTRNQWTKEFFVRFSEGVSLAVDRWSGVWFLAVATASCWWL